MQNREKWKDNIEKNEDSSSIMKLLNKLKSSVLLNKNKEEIDISKKSKINQEILQNEIINSTLNKLGEKTQINNSLENSEKKEINEVVDDWKNKTNTHDEKVTVKKYERLKDRPLSVSEEITKSVTSIEDEIKNWKTEKNPIARYLLKLADMIMHTEK